MPRPELKPSLLSVCLWASCPFMFQGTGRPVWCIHSAVRFVWASAAFEHLLPNNRQLRRSLATSTSACGCMQRTEYMFITYKQLYVWFIIFTPPSIFWHSSQTSKLTWTCIHAVHSWTPFSLPRRLILACIQNIKNVSIDFCGILWKPSTDCHLTHHSDMQFLSEGKEVWWRAFLLTDRNWSNWEQNDQWHFSYRRWVFMSILVKIKTLIQNEIVLKITRTKPIPY